jgi:hypothetical protein
MRAILPVVSNVERCSACGQLPSHPVDGGVRCVCRCGRTSVEFRQAVDLVALKQLAIRGLERARLSVHAVDTPGGYTLAIERDARPVTPGLSREDATRYADAINGEAELARAALQLIAELETVRGLLAELRSRHGSGTMPRITPLPEHAKKTG